MKYRLILVFISCGHLTSGQNSIRLPIWPSYADSTTIIGVSPNIWQKDQMKSSFTHGINFQLFGAGKQFDYVHSYPNFIGDSCFDYYANVTLGETVNGISIGYLGYSGNTKINGALISPVSTSVVLSNGVTLSFLNTCLKHSGVQIGIIMNSSVKFNGLQISLLVNSNSGTTKGCQFSLFNFSSLFKGVQIGLINKASTVEGIQFGLLNINEDRIMPIINW